MDKPLLINFSFRTPTLICCHLFKKTIWLSRPLLLHHIFYVSTKLKVHCIHHSSNRRQDNNAAINLYILYCTVLYCSVLYCTVLYCTILYCTVLYCTVLYCTVLYCTVLYCTVLYCTVLYCTVLYCTVLYCIILYCTVLYCTVLYCILGPEGPLIPLQRS